MEHLKLKVLMISSDRQMLSPGSAVSGRIKEYGALVEELHIVLLCDFKHGFKETQLDKNVWVYPTNSSFNFLRPLDAAKLGKKIVLEKGFVRGQSVVTTQDPFECGWAGMRVKKRWRIPLEVQLHTDPNSPYFTGFLNSIRKWISRGVLASADNIRDVKTLPIYVDKEKIESAPVLFDIHTLYPWQFIILCVSRLAPEKSLGVAIETLARVRERFPSTGLLFVGSGVEEGRLRSDIKKFGQEGHVEFAGWQKDLGSYYKTANIFLQTSVYEGYGLSLVEAGLSGLPVVTTNVGIATELTDRKDAYIYPVGRPDLMALGIVELIEDNQKRETIKFNLKSTLDQKLISKEEYMKRIQDNWLKTSQKIS